MNPGVNPGMKESMKRGSMNSANDNHSSQSRNPNYSTTATTLQSGPKYVSERSYPIYEEKSLRNDLRKNRFPSAPHKNENANYSQYNGYRKENTNDDSLKMLNKLMNPNKDKPTFKKDSMKPNQSLRKLIIPKPFSVHGSKYDNMELCVNGKGANLSNSYISKSSENKAYNSILQSKNKHN
jgi:hypothetical protein